MAEIKIYGSLKNDTPGGYVAKAADIYDEAIGKTQDRINAAVGNGSGFYNVDNRHPMPEGEFHTLETAVAAVSSDTEISDSAKNGMSMMFFDGEDWKFYYYKLEYDPESPTAAEDFADESNWREFKGAGGGSDDARIILKRESDNLITKVGAPVHIKFYYDHVIGSGADQQSTGNVGLARIIINRAGYQQVLSRTLTADSHYDIDLTRYMGIGITSISLQVTVDTGLIQQSAALAWTISEVALNLTSDSLSGYTVVEQGTNLEVAYTLESGSADTKAVILYLDGVQYAQNTVATSVGSGLFNVDTTGLAHGQHTIQLRAQQATGEIDEYEQPVLLYSNLIYTVIGVYTQAGTTPLLTIKVDIADGSHVFGQNEPLSLNLNQYETLTFSYGARSYDNISTEVVIKEGEDTIATATNNRESVDYSVRVLTSGSHSYSVNAGETAQIAIGVTATEVDLGVEVPSGRTMYLDAIQHGHSNTDANKNTWTNTEGGVQTSTVMTGFAWSGDGWINGALRLKGDARAEVSYRPLQATASGGMVCGFKYKCTDVEEGSEDEKIISCLDSNGTGFFITPNEITIQQNGTVRTTMKTAEGNVYDVAFVVWPASGSSSDARKNARFIYIFIDGISSGGYRLAEGSTMFQPTSVPISIGANGVTTDIYRMWAYSRALNDSEVLDTFILDQDDNIDTLLEKRDDNDILDATGNVTPDSLPDGIRVMIITGQAVEPSSGQTMASVLAAAKYNDKSTYFPAMEISSYIKGASDRSKNFIARNNGTGQETGKNIPLRIRLQGTSSLAYPVKNYRIYTNKSEMYVGNNPDMPFGETGELANKGLFALHDTSAPVNVWCLKADYAESSGTHNTGMARMVNDTFKAIGVLTPAQRDVDDTEYPYDVRTTVDGEPCLLFYRETLTDTPIFLGKFNFNNDKSTEAVYGFTGINGYHDVAPLDDIDNTDTEFVAQQYKTATGEDLEVDLTECWEFKNNEDPMGSFLDDDFNTTVTDPDSGEETPRWLGTFEARYPDEDDLNDKFADVSDPIVPHYLSTLVSWVKSTRVLDTDTEEQAAAKLQKFRDELSQYFDVEHLCSYFAFTQFMACLDQMVKNMMMGFWYDKNATTSTAMGKVRAYMIFYDNDTILGLINNGRLLAPYDVQRDTVQLYDAGGNPVYFYAGHESVLWNNLVSQFSTEIRNAYVKIRGFLTNAKIFEYFDRDQASMFCERIYNLDALNKYVAPTGMSESAVAPYRDLMQGSRKSHRRYFVEKRLSLFDNSWRAGEYYSSANEISFKGISAGGSAITLTIRKDGNVEVQSDVSDDFVKNYVVAGNTPTTIGKLTPSAVGTIFHVYGMRQLTKLDLSAWDFDQLNLGSFQYLEEFVFGSKLNVDGETDNPFTKPYYNSGLILGNSMPRLKKFVAQNLAALPSADLSGCPMIEEIDLEGSKAMGSVNIPVGAPLTKYKLPTAGITPDWRTSGGWIYPDTEKKGCIFSGKILSGTFFYKTEFYYNGDNNSDRIYLFGVGRINQTGSFYRIYIGNGALYIGNGNWISTPIKIADLTAGWHTVEGKVGQYLIFDGNPTSITVAAPQITPTFPFGILSSIVISEDGTSYSFSDNQAATMKYFQFGHNNTIEIEMYPAIDPNGVVCMYDYISKQYFYNLFSNNLMVSQEVSTAASLPNFTPYQLSLVGLPRLKTNKDWRNTGGYIESSGIQYIDTGITPADDMIVQIKAIAPNFGVLHQNNSGGMWFGIIQKSTSSNLVGEGFLSVVNTSTNINDYNNIHTYELEYKKYLKIDDTIVKSGTYSTGNSSHSMFLFQAFDINQNAPESRLGCKIYSFIVKKNNVTLMELYPAIDDNDIACMYDYITNQFFYNQGTGNFTVSQEVIDAPGDYEGDFNIGFPSKIQSLTFRDCPLINGFDLLKTIASAYNTALSTVNVTLPSAISGPIADLIAIANLWNSNTGEASNLKVYGSYTVTDESLTTAQCAAIGYDPSGAATQMSTKIYGLMVTIDQSTIKELILQSYDPNGEGYNPAVCILLEQVNLGSYVDPNDYTKGWYMTKPQAEAVTSLPTYNATTQAGAPEAMNNAPYFYARGYIKAVDTHCIVAGNSDSTKTYGMTNFDEFKYFINCAKQYLSLSRCFMWSGVRSINIPEVLNLTLGVSAFSFCEGLTYIDLPETLIRLWDNALEFSYLNGIYYGLRTLICRATTPPTISSNSIHWGSQSTYPPDFAIYVPDASVDTYKSASNWSKFASVIKPISELNNE